MSALALALVRNLGVTGCMALGIVLFYEGLPLGPLKLIPFLGPHLEQLVDGRVDRAWREGELSERLAWQEKQRRALLEVIAREKALQAELDAIANNYRQELAAKISLTLQISELEEALNEEEKNAAPGAPPRVFMPRGVSNSINAIGR